MNLTKRECVSCKWWERTGTDTGECHAFPPQSPSEYNIHRWPLTEASEWCRLFEDGTGQRLPESSRDEGLVTSLQIPPHQLTLSELWGELLNFRRDLPIRAVGWAPKRYISYRGYYDQIAIEISKNDCDVMTCGEWADATKAAIGSDFEGYKGGSYRMRSDTPVWVAGYGEVTDVGVTGVAMTHIKDAVIIKWAKME